MKLALALRTADRTPCYLAATVRALLAQGVAARDLHVFPTAPAIDWIARALPDVPLCLHVPATVRSPNENGRALVTVLDEVTADWLVMLEDDLEFCRDFVPSATRWLEEHASREHTVYRFCAFGVPVRSGATWSEYSLRDQRGSQAIALRADDARAFARWAYTHRNTWRPTRGSRRIMTGFDKFVGAWALQAHPRQQVGLVSRPQFVQHVGDQSSLYVRTRPVRGEGVFAGREWSYPSGAGA